MEGRTHDPVILKCAQMKKHQEQPDSISQRSNKLGGNYYGAAPLKSQGRLFPPSLLSACDGEVFLCECFQKTCLSHPPLQKEACVRPAGGRAEMGTRF